MFPRDVSYGNANNVTRNSSNSKLSVVCRSLQGFWSGCSSSGRWVNRCRRGRSSIVVVLHVGRIRSFLIEIFNSLLLLGGVAWLLRLYPPYWNLRGSAFSGRALQAGCSCPTKMQK
ncbi:hypothetical protein V6N13_024186 [Hibiscus sabdariffa]|uniref:Uncharacterized protein n=1 Tax=Hibiscus sabdariffa TaxID=183260 RepID=A0ABR2BWQ8_9ROSI